MSIVIKAPSGGGSISLDTQQSVTGDHTLQLPTGVGTANQILKNSSTAGTLEFNALTSGDMPTGSILQIVQTTKTDTFSHDGTSYVDVPGLSVSITPSSTSNKIFVLAMVALGGPQSGVIVGKVVRGTTDLLIGDTASNRTRGNFAQIAYGIESTLPTCTFQYLDSPSSTSAQTYKVQVVSPAGYTGGVNRTGYHADNSSYPVAASSITVMEVAA